MIVHSRNFRLNIVCGASLCFQGLLRFHRPGQVWNVVIFFLAGSLFMLVSAAPAAIVKDDKIVIVRFGRPRTILFKDVARVVYLPASFWWRPSDIVLEELSGRKTSILPHRPGRFIEMLFARLPCEARSSSSEVAPPPLPLSSVPWHQRSMAQLLQKPFGWMSMVYDWRTHSIRKPSDTNDQGLNA
jgi:hypothetical protein